MNIYADRGNIIFLQRRCGGATSASAHGPPGRERGPHRASDLHRRRPDRDPDVAEDMLARDAIASAVDDGRVLPFGGYQLLGRSYQLDERASGPRYCRPGPCASPAPG
jgi:hypothetical protein